MVTQTMASNGPFSDGTRDASNDNAAAFNSLFHAPGQETLPVDILGELQSVARMNALDPQDLFYKWESYALKMGADTELDLQRVSKCLQVC